MEGDQDGQGERELRKYRSWLYTSWTTYIIRFNAGLSAFLSSLRYFFIEEGTNSHNYLNSKLYLVLPLKWLSSDYYAGSIIKLHFSLTSCLFSNFRLMNVAELNLLESELQNIE